MFKIKQQKAKPLNLPLIVKTVEKATREVMLETANRVFDISQNLVPVDKGDLKASGAVEVTRGGDTVEVGYGTDHAIPQEFGTHKMAAQSYLRPAAEQVAQETGKSLGDIVVRTQKELK